MARRRSKGMLRRLRYPKSKSRHRITPLGRLAHWTGSALTFLAVIALLVLLGIRYFNPRTVMRHAETEAAVEEIVEDGAAAIVTVSGERLRIPLAPDERGTLEVGTRIVVKYLMNPAQPGSIQLQGWSPVRTEPEVSR